MAIDKEKVILGANDGFGDIVAPYTFHKPLLCECNSVLNMMLSGPELLAEAGYENGLNLN